MHHHSGCWTLYRRLDSHKLATVDNDSMLRNDGSKSDVNAGSFIAGFCCSDNSNSDSSSK